MLYRVRRTGGLQRVWSGGRAGYRGAAIARTGTRLAIAWLARVPSRHSPFGRPVLRLTTSADGRRFTPARTLNGVLPSWLATEDIGYVSSLGLALDAGASPTVGLTAWHRPSPVLVLASSRAPDGCARAG